MKYKLLALDVDGTLVRPDQTVAPQLIDALARADAAGLKICLATGRSYVETMPVWQQLRLGLPYQPLVLIGGALVSEPDTGRTLFQRTIPHDLACQYADALLEEGYSAMAIVDAWRHGVDYFFAQGPDAQAEANRWFSKMNVKVQNLRRLADAPDMPGALRISAVIDADKAPDLAARLKNRFDGQLNIHPIHAPNYGVTIVEAFSAKADKFGGIMYLAQAMRLGAGAISAVGDDVNDLPMIRGAALGVAMAKAPQHVKDQAKHVMQADGLAAFVDELVAGRFD